LKPTIAKIFGRLTEAFQTLNDPTKKAAYLESLKSGGGTGSGGGGTAAQPQGA
jgi:DnaJ-class molecular chaperone